MTNFDQIQNTFLLTTANNLRTGNQFLDAAFVIVFTPVLMQLFKYLFEYVHKIPSVLYKFLFEHKQLIATDVYAFTMNIKSERGGQSDGILRINPNNEYIILGLARFLSKEGCMHHLPQTTLRTVINERSILPIRDQLLQAEFVLQPEKAIMYNGMKFTFVYKESIGNIGNTSGDSSTSSKPTLKMEHSVEIKYNDQQELFKLLQQCNHDQVIHDYPSPDVRTDGRPYLYLYRLLRLPDEDPSVSMYSKSPFKSQRSFKSIHFAQKELLIQTLDQFFNRIGPWDPSKERPHKLVILLHGISGAGKSSSIKAIANRHDLHPVIVNLGDCRNDRDLHKVFFTNTMAFNNIIKHRREYDHIPPEHRMIVLEDADAGGCSWLRERETEQDSLTKVDVVTPVGSKVVSHHFGRPTLSGFLNTLDGIEELSSIVVITTNHINHLDSALFRCGRVDLAIQFTHCDAQSATKHLQWFYNVDTLDSETTVMIDNMFNKQQILIASSQLQEMCQLGSTPLEALKHYETVICSRQKQKQKKEAE